MEKKKICSVVFNPWMQLKTGLIHIENQAMHCCKLKQTTKPGLQSPISKTRAVKAQAHYKLRAAYLCKSPSSRTCARKVQAKFQNQEISRNSISQSSKNTSYECSSHGWTNKDIACLYKRENKPDVWKFAFYALQSSAWVWKRAPARDYVLNDPYSLKNIRL